jgi:hypothetical protein
MTVRGFQPGDIYAQAARHRGADLAGVKTLALDLAALENILSQSLQDGLLPGLKAESFHTAKQPALGVTNRGQALGEALAIPLELRPFGRMVDVLGYSPHGMRRLSHGFSAGCKLFSAKCAEIRWVILRKARWLPRSAGPVDRIGSRRNKWKCHSEGDLDSAQTGVNGRSIRVGIAMRFFVLFSCLVAACHLSAQQRPVWQPSPGHTQISIWPGAAPDPQPVAGPENVETSAKNFRDPGRPISGVNNVTRPTMTVYSPQGKNTGVAVVVFPGGGYQTLAIDLEGTEVCDWLTPRGITCVLLKYRVTDVGPYPKSGPYPESPMALEDAQRTMGLVRLHAAQWGIDPHKVGVLGSGCTRRLTPRIKKAVGRILRCQFIPGTCRWPRRSGMPNKAPRSLWFVMHPMPIRSFR